MARIRLTCAGCSLLASPRSKNRRKPPCRMFRIATRTIVSDSNQIFVSASGRFPLATAKYGELPSIAAAGGIHSAAVSQRKCGVCSYEKRGAIDLHMTPRCTPTVLCVDMQPQHMPVAGDGFGRLMRKIGLASAIYGKSSHSKTPRGLRNDPYVFRTT